MTTRKFLEPADRFIDLANRMNRQVPATEIQTILLYAAAGYDAHVAKNVLDVRDRKDFVDRTTKA